ncbi:protein mono-ADP-ribosyltransferase PARP14-like [Dendronephthya gigantea]|uniref:protein mono-ADP-ribosyltransferase PARP14-like n=1 Tax=Dendronephthya gigantea TaxID=151771 RepID=UPI0010691163|nr:protein mono-ADP-ribosyltransferase PARP14-like [Dendronephthya gigantea]
MISSTKSPPAEPTSKLLCSHETREKILLKVYKDNITAHPCDVIVNAANGDLKHIGGVAKSILDAGGREIQDECDEHVKENGKLFDGQCFSGSPGKLPCKVLVHAVGPRWDASNREKICKLLSVTCTRALEEAIKYRSIALPAIGSGVYGIPKDVCAEIMIEAAEKFSRNHEDSSVKEIHFVNNDDASGHVFVKKFREKFGGRPSLIRNEEKPANSRFYASLKPSSQSVTKETARKAVSIQDDLQKRKSDDSIFTTQNMKISVVVGDLATYKADVLVNTTGHTLDLEANPCSKALSYEAGPTLQSECRRIGKLNVGQVAVTTGGNLLCDEVFHVVCDKWRRGQGEEVLRVIIKKCLKKCNSNGKKSIAFPAIGTGVLGFPHDVAAKIFFEETKDFEKRVPNSSIEEVSFVVYSRDSESIKAFKKEIKRQSEWGSGVSVGKVSDGQQKRWKRNPVGVGVEKGDLCVEIGNGKKVEIVKGDITKERSDVIAHLTNPSLFMRSGVAIALVKAGGNDIERASQNIGSSYKLLNATTVLTTAGRLDAKYVAHMVASNDPSFSEIEKCITNCLNRVTEKKCESISFPAVGTGSLKNDPGKAAKTIFSSVVRFLQSSTGSLKTVRIVLKDDDLVEAFQASVKKFNESEEPGVFKKIVNYFWSTESPAALKVVENTPVTTTELLLEIYAQNEATVGIAKEKILNVIEKQKKKEKLDDENIVKLSSMQVEEIKRWCDVNDVKVTIDKELNRIIMFGHSEDISTMITKIYQVLKKIGERERAEMHAEYAEMVSKSVQWFYVDPATGDHEEYHKHTNAAIEKAYSKNEKSVIFDLIDGKCKIVFDRMQEMNLDTNVKTEVMRKDLKEISVPDYWEPQPLDANGKELVVHLVLLNPKNPNHKKECMEISDHFNRTCGQQILQIERIQNPSLYKQYVTKKNCLDQKGEKVRSCWASSPDKLEEITEKGLNRSYAGNTHGNC